MNFDSVKSGLRISAVTPSFNQADFLGDCLRSVRIQNYGAIEHLVYDPGSTDGSREIAENAEGVTLFSESDEGQSDAVNKGIERAKGDIIAWINSDDCYASDAVFARVVERFEADDAPDIVYGRGVYLDEKGDKLRDAYVNTKAESFRQRLAHEVGIMQPAAFFRRSVWERVGLLRVDRHFTLDYEFWIRCAKAGLKFAFVDDVFAYARYHLQNKTYGSRGLSYEEICSVTQEHYGFVHAVWLQRYAEFLSDGHDGVLRSAANSGLVDRDACENIYKELLIAYNGGYDAYGSLVRNRGEVNESATLKEMDRLGASRQTPCEPIPLDCARKNGSVCYTVATRRWAFDANWKREQIEKSHAFLRDEIRNRSNDVCVIVGNGPSLKKTDLALLAGQDVILSNNAFLSEELMRNARYYTVVNYLVAEQSCAAINRLKGVDKVLPYWLSYCLNPGEGTYFVDAVGYPEFSTDIFKNMSWRHTVSFFNLHLAYGLGYRKVVMIGFDHSYTQPKGAKEQETILSYGKDENHFVDSYFQGKQWQAADVNMMEEMYRLAKTAFEADGRRIVNATVGGMLELFDREGLADAIRPDLKDLG